MTEREQELRCVISDLRDQMVEQDALIKQQAAQIEALKLDYIALLECRERESERLDWLLARISGAELRRLVGEMECTIDAGEWRDKLDKAMGYKTI